MFSKLKLIPFAFYLGLIETIVLLVLYGLEMSIPDYDFSGLLNNGMFYNGIFKLVFSIVTIGFVILLTNLISIFYTPSNILGNVARGFVFSLIILQAFAFFIVLGELIIILFPALILVLAFYALLVRLYNRRNEISLLKKNVIVLVVTVLSLLMSILMILNYSKIIKQKIELYNEWKNTPEYLKFYNVSASNIPIRDYVLSPNSPNGNFGCCLFFDTLITDNKLLFGLVDSNGVGVFPPICDMIFPVNDQNEALCVINGKFGIIDSKGFLVVPAQFDYIIEYKKGWVKFFQGKFDDYMSDFETKGSIGLADKSGKVLIEANCNNRIEIMENLITLRGEGFNSNMVIYNIHGNIIRNDTMDDSVSDYSNGLAFLTQKDNSMSVINNLGEVLYRYEGRTIDFNEFFRIFMMSRVVQKYEIVVYNKSLNRYVISKVPELRMDTIHDLENMFDYQGVGHRTSKCIEVEKSFFSKITYYPHAHLQIPPDSVEIQVDIDDNIHLFTYSVKDNTLVFRKILSQ